MDQQNNNSDKLLVANGTHSNGNGADETNTPIGVFLSAECSVSNGARQGDANDDTLNTMMDQSNLNMSPDGEHVLQLSNKRGSAQKVVYRREKSDKGNSQTAQQVQQMLQKQMHDGASQFQVPYDQLSGTVVNLKGIEDKGSNRDKVEEADWAEWQNDQVFKNLNDQRPFQFDIQIGSQELAPAGEPAVSGTHESNYSYYQQQNTDQSLQQAIADSRPLQESKRQPDGHTREVISYGNLKKPKLLQSIDTPPKGVEKQEYSQYVSSLQTEQRMYQDKLRQLQQRIKRTQDQNMQQQQLQTDHQVQSDVQILRSMSRDIELLERDFAMEKRRATQDQLLAPQTTVQNGHNLSELDSPLNYKPLRLKQDQSEHSLASYGRKNDLTSPIISKAQTNAIDNSFAVEGNSSINQVVQRVSKKQADADISVSDFHRDGQRGQGIRVKRDYSPSVGDIKDFTKGSYGDQGALNHPGQKLENYDNKQDLLGFQPHYKTKLAQLEHKYRLNLERDRKMSQDGSVFENQDLSLPFEHQKVMNYSQNSGRRKRSQSDMKSSLNSNEKYKRNGDRFTQGRPSLQERSNSARRSLRNASKGKRKSLSRKSLHQLYQNPISARVISPASNHVRSSPPRKDLSSKQRIGGSRNRVVQIHQKLGNGLVEDQLHGQSFDEGRVSRNTGQNMASNTQVTFLRNENSLIYGRILDGTDAVANQDFDSVSTKNT